MSEESKDEEYCPKVQPINNNMEKLSYDEKLQLIEDEAKTLYAFCMNKKFTPSQIHACVSKLRGPPPPRVKKTLADSASSFVVLSIFVALIGTVCLSDSVYNLFVVHARLFSIKIVLPYWDWSKLYAVDCMIDNPYLPLENKTINEKYCEYCINVVKYGHNIIDRLNDTNGETITTHYIQNGQPVVVTDTTKDWQSKKKLSMDEIAYIYQNDPMLTSNMGSCEYSTNVGFNETFYDFISAYVDKKLPENWHANWENCDVKAGKVLRKYYTRPYFLPGMAQASSENSVIVSKGKHHDQWFNGTFSGRNSGYWFTVVTGSLDFELNPDEECGKKFNCEIAKVSLGAGETLFFTMDDWEVRYSPADDDITIAIGSSVIWDEMRE